MPKESPAAVLVDEQGNLIRIDSEGNRHAIAVRDQNQEVLLKLILHELRTMRLYLRNLAD